MKNIWLYYKRILKRCNFTSGLRLFGPHCKLMSFLHTEWRNLALVVGGASQCAVLATVMSAKASTPTATRRLENVAARYEDGIFFNNIHPNCSEPFSITSITKCHKMSLDYLVTKYLFPTGQLLSTERRWHLFPLWLLPFGCHFTLLRPRDGSMPLQGGCDWPTVQPLRQPLLWSDQHGLWGYVLPLTCFEFKSKMC